MSLSINLLVTWTVKRRPSLASLHQISIIIDNLLFVCILLVPPSIVDAESSPSQMSVRENVRVSLVCKAYGVPEARVSWRREDGRSLMEGKMNSSSSSSSPSSLPQENANNKRGTGQ